MTESVFDYSKKSHNTPKYSYLKLVPDSGTADIVVTTAGGQEAIVSIPSGVYNMAKSYLEFTMVIAAPAGGAGNFNYLFTGALGLLRQVELYNRFGQYLVRLNEVQTFSEVSNKICTSLPDLLDEPNGYNGVGVLSGIRASGGSATTIGKFALRPTAVTTGAKDCVEPSYVEVGATGAAFTAKYRIPLKNFRHSFLALNKDVPFPSIMQLRLVFNPSTKIGFYSTDIAAPQTGSAALAVSATVSALKLQMCREDNQALASEIMSVAMSPSGLNLLSDYVWTHKNAVAQSTSQSVILRVNKSNGARLKHIYHVPILTETINNGYNHNAIGGAATVATYNTVINNRREQDSDLIVSNLDDYEFNLNKIRGSALSGPSIYQYNWVHISDLCNSNKPIHKQIVEDENEISGHDLSQEVEFQFNATTADTALNHYSFIVCQRDVNISSQGIVMA